MCHTRVCRELSGEQLWDINPGRDDVTTLPSIVPINGRAAGNNKNEKQRQLTITRIMVMTGLMIELDERDPSGNNRNLCVRGLNESDLCP